jgi:uncharacterized protein YdhG (YjbR/CyaY superfamily)
MAKTAFKTVDEYIASRPLAVQPALKQVRAAIRKALPGAQEVISYQIAAFRQPEGIVVFFAGWTEHYSIYPASAALVAALAKELEPYELSKGTIRFPLAGRVPVRLIARIAKLRAQEVALRVAARKKAAKKKPTKKRVTKKKVMKRR